MGVDSSLTSASTPLAITANGSAMERSPCSNAHSAKRDDSCHTSATTGNHLRHHPDALSTDAAQRSHVLLSTDEPQPNHSPPIPKGGTATTESVPSSQQQLGSGTWTRANGVQSIGLGQGEITF